MIKRSFLKPLSVVLAALASASAWGSTKSVPPSAPLAPETFGTAPADSANLPIADSANLPIQPNEAREVLFRQDGDLFKFVLERTSQGTLLAQHYSHSSHDSHSSHSSHSSHRSHYSGG
jgi:hypothetical protein